ncbi:acyl-CoA dehydrogenase family protein [Rhodococcus sp. OK302]|uniref:acyl-CoA dehydrogenase family protein n=1 Tax=Rhodococcus sp. OK302 TaxID=1882769 RepID=UPI000B945D78|nr:acyl-CoA dehydrogenase family protein [Rhodococcus sp. OK302]OYD68289.1 alkylation response protein AidB-like acyl-CoA dehydrogenase [Rhodococcus sp. OK302]
MQFGFTPEQAALRDGVRRFLDTSDRQQNRQLVDSDLPYDTAMWRRAADELGLMSVPIPAEFDGAGGGMVELAIILEEFGQRLTRSPFLATVGLASTALLASGDSTACAEYLPRIASGELIATFALPVGVHSMAHLPVDASDDGRLTGVAEAVIDAESADLLIVPAQTSYGTDLFAVQRADLDIQADAAAPAYDLVTRSSRIRFDDTPAVRLGAPDPDKVERAFALAIIALAAEQVGGAQACLDDCVEYAKTRTQFGRPIGSFQAIKHRCADVLVKVEGARSLLYHAAWLADQGATEELILVAAMTKAWCSDTYVLAAEANLLTHGGIGFTWEHDAHLHFRRSRSRALTLGSSDDHRDAVAARLLLAETR